MIVNVFVAFHEWELSFSRPCSWLKGEPPGTRTLAAGIKKIFLEFTVLLTRSALYEKNIKIF